LESTGFYQALSFGWATLGAEIELEKGIAEGRNGDAEGFSGGCMREKVLKRGTT